MTKIGIYAKVLHSPKTEFFDSINMTNIIKTIKQRKIEILVLVGFVFHLVFPQYNPALAAEFDQDASILLPILAINAYDGEELLSEANQTFSLDPPAKVYEVVATYTVPITAYSSTVDQTDSTPCITANGFDLCAHNQEDVIAANFLPFGAKVRIPEHFGDRIFTVQDRMNARYHYRADLWMRNRVDAIKWGLKYTKIEVVK